MNTKTSALVFAIVMVFSSFVGCIDADDSEETSTSTTSDASSLGNVMVSTYHVAELVRAVGGDRITVEIISPSNVPVHDYEPSAADLIRLQDVDLFFYHGLNLEPWVDATISSLGSDAPLVVRTHAMPTGENTLDYQSMLLNNICETLNDDAYEAITLADHHDEAGDVEIHAEAMTHKVSYPEMDDDHGDEDDHDDHDGHGDEDNHDDHGHDDHGDHDEHDAHEDHNHAEAEKVIENPSDCPSDTSVSIFHLEEGEYLLEFEYGEATDFDMVVLKMAGGHAHHDHHGHGDEHGDDHDDHDDHGDDHDDHDDHDDEMTPELALQNFDSNNDSHISWDEFWAGWTSNNHDDHDDGHDDDHGDDHDDDHGDDHDDDHGDEHDEHDDHDDHGDEHESKIYDSCTVSTDPHDGHYECWMNDWLDSDGNVTMSDGYDEEECTELANSSWECERHDPIEEATEEYITDLLMEHFNQSDIDGDMLLSIDELGNFIEEIEHLEDELESATFQIMISAFDDDEDGTLSMSEFGIFMETMDDGHDEAEMMEIMFNMVDANSDGSIDASELEMMMEMGDGHHDEHDDHEDHPVAFATLHIEEEGDYGFALPPGIEYFILMGEGGHDDHSDHGHGDHSDHGDEHSVCHDTTNHVNTEHDNKADCEAAGHMWMEDHDEGPCHDMNTHNSTEHDNKVDCEAAGHLWMEEHSDDDSSDGGSEIVADEGEEAFEYDPHSWLSPVAYKAQLNIVLESLVTVFPDGEDDFRANAEAYSAELDKLDLDYTAAFGEGGTCEAGSVEKTIVANHNAYAYISQRYDIEILTVHGLDPEGEPSAADIVEVVEQIEEKNITVLYVEEYTDTSSVDSIVQQTGVTIEVLYTMELPPKNNEDTYLTLMSKNLDSLVEGMGC